jgi:hypothetical protein
MACPPEIAPILLEIVRLGILSARAAGWNGDSARAALEADHVHNLPALIADCSPEAMRYYWEVERPLYLAKRGPSQTGALQPLWDRLAAVLEFRGTSQVA